MSNDVGKKVDGFKYLGYIILLSQDNGYAKYVCE